MPTDPIFLLTLEGSVGTHKLFAWLGGSSQPGLSTATEPLGSSAHLSQSPSPKLPPGGGGKPPPQQWGGKRRSVLHPGPDMCSVLGVKHLDFGPTHLFSLLCIYKNPSFSAAFNTA